MTGRVSALEGRRPTEAHVTAGPGCVRYVADPRTGRILHQATVAAAVLAAPGVAHASAHVAPETAAHLWERLNRAWERISAWVAPPPAPPPVDERELLVEFGYIAADEIQPTDEDRVWLEVMGYIEPDPE